MYSSAMAKDTIRTVSDIGNDYQLITGTHDRNIILDHIGEDIDKWSHGSLFVKTHEGTYSDVLFFAGNTPYLNKSVTRII